MYNEPSPLTVCFAIAMLPLHENLVITYNNIGIRKISLLDANDADSR